MKNLLILFVSIICGCSSTEKLLVTKIPDAEKVIVEKGYFSGIHYLYMEKAKNRKVLSRYYYDCECGIHKIRLLKITMSGSSALTWNSVTDTLPVPTFFGDTIKTTMIHSPMSFIPITTEEITLLSEGLKKANKECCVHPEKPLTRIIGFVRMRRNY